MIVVRELYSQFFQLLAITNTLFFCLRSLYLSIVTFLTNPAGPEQPASLDGATIERQLFRLASASSPTRDETIPSVLTSSVTSGECLSTGTTLMALTFRFLHLAFLHSWILLLIRILVFAGVGIELGYQFWRFWESLKKHLPGICSAPNNSSKSEGGVGDHGCVGPQFIRCHL